MRIPIFIELAQTEDAKVCAKAVQMLMQGGMQPIGLCTSPQELQDVMAQLKQHNLEPAIFVVNTYGTKELLPVLDPIMGERPVVFVRRALYVGQSGLQDSLMPDPNKAATMAVIGKMTIRLTSVWTYGSKNTDQIAQRLAKCMQRFAEDGNFRYFEIESKVGGKPESSVRRFED